MRGLYINASPNRLSCSIEIGKEFASRVKHKTASGDTFEVIYDSFEWPEPPVYHIDEEHFFICYGWFIFQNEKNNLKQFAHTFTEHGVDALQHILAGVFVIAEYINGRICVINDHLGVSSHYKDNNQEKFTLSPSANGFEGSKIVPELQGILERHGCLFGNYTCYRKIERLEPGSVTEAEKEHIYYIPSFGKSEPEKGIDEIKKIVEYWPSYQRTLAISGGLDSRLILAAAPFAFGYTYGPENSGDRPLARKFKRDFDRYIEFDFLAPPENPKEKEFFDELFSSTSTYVYRLLSAYQFARIKAEKSHAFFDGYLGDTLQRGAFLKIGGVIGELLRLFPALYKLNFSAKFILKKRYSKLTDCEFELLYQDFKQRTDNLNISDYQKVTYYEFVYGRGARYVVHGGNLTGGQFFTVIPVFAVKNVFESMIGVCPADGFAFKHYTKIWKNVSSNYKNIPTETGYKVTTPALLIPFIQFCYRFAIHFMPNKGNYGNQMRKAVKGKR